MNTLFLFIQIPPDIAPLRSIIKDDYISNTLYLKVYLHKKDPLL